MIQQKDIKLLWGRSADRCAICQVKLSLNSESDVAALTLGEQAHIVGEKPDAPRGKSILNDQERNSYHNLILLCPTHHTEVDKNEGAWPAEKLHLIKSKHELWVEETLSETRDIRKLANQTIVASIIDTAVEHCRLRDWQNWTSRALAPEPSWPAEFPEQIFTFREKVIAAVWPEEFDELKRATITFSILLNCAARLFMEHCEPLKYDESILQPYKFYEREVTQHPNYCEKDLKKYMKWLAQCYSAVREATKAANWFADVVRRDINPMFFASEGKFLVTEGPFWYPHTRLLEFESGQKEILPDSLFRGRVAQKGKGARSRTGSNKQKTSRRARRSQQ